jgi:hypothetical protein
MHSALMILIGLVVGLVAGNVMGILLGHEAITRSSVFYKELVIRGDAAIAGLQHASHALQNIGRPIGNGAKRIVTSEDIAAAKIATRPPLIVKE